MSNGVAPKRAATPRTSAGGDEQEHRAGIDEAADQPGTGDAVDLRPRPRHPDGAPLRVARRQPFGRHGRQPGRRPGLDAAFERFGQRPEMAQPRGGALAELEAAVAGDDHPAPSQRRPPMRDRLGVPPAARRGSAAGRRRSPRRCARRRSTGVSERPSSRASLSGAIEFGFGMAASSLEAQSELDAMLGLSPRGETAGPLARHSAAVPRDVNRRGAGNRPGLAQSKRPNCDGDPLSAWRRRRISREIRVNDPVRDGCPRADTSLDCLI